MGLEFKTDTSGNPIPRVPEGSDDTKGLLHNSKNEIEVSSDGGGGGGVPEAPNDGQQYARQSEAWSVVTSSGGGGIQSIQEGSNITVDNTDPQNPIVSASSSSGGDSEPSKWKNKKYSSFGDSITWYDGNGLTGYQQEIIRINEINSSDYVNEGVNGMTITNRVPDADSKKLVKIIDTFDFTNIDLVTLCLGTNDFSKDAPIGSISSTTDTEFYGAFNIVIDEILTQNPSIKLVLITPPQRDIQDTPNGVGFVLLDYVKAIRGIAQKYSLQLMDWYANGDINELTFNTYTLDGLHPNNLGLYNQGLVFGQYLKYGTTDVFISDNSGQSTLSLQGAIDNGNLVSSATPMKFDDNARIEFGGDQQKLLSIKSQGIISTIQANNQSLSIKATGNKPITLTGTSYISAESGGDIYLRGEDELRIQDKSSGNAEVVTVNFTNGNIDSIGDIKGNAFVTDGGTSDQVVLGDGTLRTALPAPPLADGDYKISVVGGVVTWTTV